MYYLYLKRINLFSNFNLLVILHHRVHIFKLPIYFTMMPLGLYFERVNRAFFQ